MVDVSVSSYDVFKPTCDCITTTTTSYPINTVTIDYNKICGTYAPPYSNKTFSDDSNKTKATIKYDHLVPKKVIYNDPATVVFWSDGTKTVVKRSAGDKPNVYNAFCAALAKKIYGNNSAVRKIVANGYHQNISEKTEKQKREIKNAGNGKSKKRR